MAEIILRLPKLHPAQRQVAKKLKRFNTLACGRRWGKSVLGADFIVSGKNGALDGYPVAWASPNYKFLTDVFSFCRTTLAPVTARVDASQKVIELITGGRIDFLSLDDPDAGRSRKFAKLVVDEAAFCPYLVDQWHKALRPTLTDYQGDACFLSTPNGGNFFKRLYEFGDPESSYYDPEWSSWRFPTLSNPHINPKEVEAARKSLPSLVFAQEYEAKFLDMAGALMKSEYLRYGTPPAGAKLTTSIGVDLAISQKTSADYTVIAVLQRDEVTGYIYIREVLRFRKPFHEILKEIQRMAAKWNPLVIAIEQVAYQMAVVQELLRTTTLPVRGVTPKGDKTARFMPVLARYEQGLIYHDKGMSQEFERELLAFPEDEHDDQVDGVVIAYRGLDYCQATPTNFSIPLL